MDKIFISNLQLETLIGVYEWERVQKQPLLLDIEVALNTHKSAITDLLKDTLDYDVLLKRLKIWVGEACFYLLEALAEYICEKLFQEFSVEGIRLRLSKPNIMPHGGQVGIMIERGEL